MQEIKIDDRHATSLLPEGHDWKLAWHDEFDGPVLDRSKWGFRRHFWGRRFDTFAGEEAIRFDGKSNVELHLIRQGDDYSAPLLQTGSLTWDIPKDSQGFWPFGRYEQPRFMHRYGYYECRCRLQRQPGWWTAFWLQAPGIGATPDPGASGVEVDIMESFQPGEIISHALHWNGYGYDHRGMHSNGLARIDHKRDIMRLDLDDYHYFGVHWARDGYTFYVDGVQSGQKLTDAVSHTEQFILLHGECKGYRVDGKPCEEVRAAVLPEAFVVDHVRVFDEVNL